MVYTSHESGLSDKYIHYHTMIIYIYHKNIANCSWPRVGYRRTKFITSIVTLKPHIFIITNQDFLY